MTYTQENMPFTREGLVPDLILNPHAIPSRMTVAHLLETLTGKVTCLTGQQFDADAFQGHDYVAKITEALHEAGYERNGNEVLYCPQTGKRMVAKVFFGPICYQRLKHLVGSKLHARAKGRNLQLTRQPTEGRGNDGGLRVGRCCVC
jgi:DNA-directed RNA polymerase II subunit RPB2